MGSGSSTSAGGSTKEKAAVLRKTPFFVIFDDKQIETIAQYFKVQKLAQGEELTNQSMVVVADGELSVSTLIPSSRRSSPEGPKSNASKTNVSELLCMKKSGDFFARPSRELIQSSRDFKKGNPSVSKVVETFDFTTVRAMLPTTILKLEPAAKAQYLSSPGAASAGLLESVIKSDIRSLLRSVPFLRSLEPTKLGALAELFTFEGFAQGTEIMVEGDTDDRFYLVLSGDLDITASVMPDYIRSRSVNSIVDPAVLLAMSELAQGKALTQIMTLPSNSGPAGDADTKAASSPRTASSTQPEEANSPGSAKSGEKEGSAGISLSATPHAGHVNAGDASAGVIKKKRTVPELRPLPSIRLLRKGSSLVDPNAKVVRLGTIGTGSYFGELGLLLRSPRSATVTALSKCLLACMKGKDFNNFLKLHPAVRDALDLHAKERMVNKLYAFRLPFFAGITRDRMLELAQLSEIRQYASETTIVKEGDVSGMFHILVNGVVSVVRGGETIVRLGKGSYFGEISLLTGNPHLATVCAFTEVVLLSISKEGFETFFKESPQLLAEFEMRVLGPRAMQLRHVLRHKLGAELFRQHVTNEHTVEHLDFFEAVETFRVAALADAEALRAHDEGPEKAAAVAEAQKKLEYKHDIIVGKFIGPNAKEPVNVSANQAERVTSGTVSPEVFDECQTEIYNLLKRDNFDRFKKTPLFTELLDAISCYTEEDLRIDEAEATRAEFIAAEALET